MSTIATAIGLAAAVCTTAANLPQLKKAWVTGQTDDLSLKTLLLFASGLVLWIIYGFLQTDFVIILANGISLLILSVILYLKLTQRPTHPPQQHEVRGLFMGDRPELAIEVREGRRPVLALSRH